MVGWRLNEAAAAARRREELPKALLGVGDAELMNPRPAVVDPLTSVEELVTEYMSGGGRRALPVVVGGRLVGLVSITDAWRVPREAWRVTPVSSIMSGLPLETASTDEDLARALRRMVDKDVNQMPVVSSGVLMGLLSRVDILRVLQRHADASPGGT